MRGRTIKMGHVLGTLIFLISLVAVAIITTSQVMAQDPENPRDFFGAVVSVGDEFLIVSTPQGDVQVPIAGAKVGIRGKKDAKATDLVEGDAVAVSLDEDDGEVVAKIRRIPDKTGTRHVPGTLITIGVTGGTVLPPSFTLGDQIDFTLPDSGNTPVRLAEGRAKEFGVPNNTDLKTVGPANLVDKFVVLALIDQATGAPTNSTSLVVKAIHVTGASSPPLERPTGGNGDGRGNVAGPSSAAEIRGRFDGIDADGNWLIGKHKVAVNADTEVETGLVAGQVAEVEAEIQPDGSLLATSIEGKKQGHPDHPKVTRLKGVFQRVDDAGNWIISGTPIAIGHDTDTDGRPVEGQGVKVKALLQGDGTLLARVIENEHGRRGPKEDPREARLEGIFQGTDDQGNWIVNGTRVAVDALTRLEGTPGVGRRVAVRAVLQRGGSLLAHKMEGDEGDVADAGDSRQRRAEAKLRGVIQEVLDGGTLVVNGARVAVDVLTEIEGSAAVGDFVEVKGLLREDGSLLATEVTSEGDTETEDGPEGSKVDIEGKIERVNPDGSLVVNGIRIATSVLSEIKGELVEGSPVKVKGVLLQDGSLLARQLRGEGRRATASGTEAKIEGLVERLNRDEAGNIVSFVVDGLTVATGALTRVEGQLEPGARVTVKAIVSGGGFLAGRVEGSTRAGRSEASEAKLQGIIEALRLDAQGRVVGIKVNGLEVALAALAKLEGPVAVGETVEIKGRIQGGTFAASKVEAERPSGKRPRSTELKLEGLVEAVERDAEGNILALVVNGRKIGVEAITRVKGSLDLGAAVRVHAVIKDGGLVASEIKGTPEQRKGSKEQSESEGGRGNGLSDDESKPGRGSSDKSGGDDDDKKKRR